MLENPKGKDSAGFRHFIDRELNENIFCFLSAKQFRE
jgi:hypothetical protein